MEAELNCINRIVDKTRQDVIDCSNEDECLTRKRFATDCEDSKDALDGHNFEAKRPAYNQADPYYSKCTPPSFKPLNSWECHGTGTGHPNADFPVKVKTEHGPNIYVKCEPGEANIVTYAPCLLQAGLMPSSDGETKFDFDYFFENLVHLSNNSLQPPPPQFSVSPGDVEFIPSSTDVISDEEFMLLMDC
jgi:hypothetical protein